MSTTPLSIAAPAAGAFMTQEPALFSPGAQQSGVPYVAMATNLSITERRYWTRGNWRELQLEGDVPEDWAEANTQGCCAYDPRVARTPVNPVSGGSGIIESAAGKLFRISPLSKTFTVEDISSGIVGADFMRIAYVVQARSFVIRTDPGSPTQIWDGTTTVTSTGYNQDTPASSRLPNFAGPIAFGDRIWVTNKDTEILAGDHVNRLDFVGTGDVLKFTEQSYDFTGTSFKAPIEMGAVTSLNMVTSYRGGNLAAQAEIVVGTEGQGMWGIMAGTPRSQWGTNSMRRIIHQTVAPVGPFASWASNDEMIFRTQYGVASIKYLAQETQQIGNPLTNLAQEIRPLLDLDPLDLLQYASLYSSPRMQRLILTTWPYVTGLNRAHKGYVSMSLSPSRTRVPEPGVWEGVNTLPKAMGDVIQFVEVRDLDKLRLFALTLKEDGTKGLCEWTNQYCDDILADGSYVRIPWQIHTRKLAYSGELSPSSWGCVYLNLINIRDKVSVKIFARSRTHDDYKQVYEGSFTNKTWGELQRGYADTEGVPIGTILTGLPASAWVEMLIQGEGCCGVDLAILSGNSGNPNDNPGQRDQCITGETLCKIDYFKRN
jgi:hypothetical protein